VLHSAATLCGTLKQTRRDVPRWGALEQWPNSRPGRPRAMKDADWSHVKPWPRTETAVPATWLKSVVVFVTLYLRQQLRNAVPVKEAGPFRKVFAWTVSGKPQSWRLVPTAQLSRYASASFRDYQGQQADLQSDVATFTDFPKNTGDWGLLSTFK
jgi:hypothetical protein